MDLERFNLPKSVEDNIQFQQFEDLLVAIFKRGLPDVNFRTTIPEELTRLLPLVVGKRFLRQGNWSGDPRFIDTGYIRINVLTKELDDGGPPIAEEQALYIAEAVRVMMFKASRERWYFPGLGSILNITMETEPEANSDWATASGIVQFADLPKHFSRVETVYRMTIRRPRKD